MAHPGAGWLPEPGGFSAIVLIAFAVTDERAIGDPTAPVLHLFTLGRQHRRTRRHPADGGGLALRDRLLRPSRRRPRPGLAPGHLAIAAVALLVIAGYTVKDFDVLVGAGPDSVLSWLLPALIAAALVVGLAQGLVLALPHTRGARPYRPGRRGVPTGQGGGSHP